MPPGVADQQQPAGVVRLAVEAHRQRGAADRADHGLVAVSPTPRAWCASQRLQHVLVVDVAEGRGGVEDAEADVGGAVADAEDPAVAGQQHPLAGLVAVPQLEPGLQVVVVVAGVV